MENIKVTDIYERVKFGAASLNLKGQLGVLSPGPTQTHHPQINAYPFYIELRSLKLSLTFYVVIMMPVT